MAEDDEAAARRVLRWTIGVVLVLAVIAAIALYAAAHWWNDTARHVEGSLG